MSGMWYGCGGTRQTATEKHSNFEVQNSYSEGSKIVLGNTFTYTPFDALKPMKIEGKVYNNVIVSNDKSKTITKWKNRNITKTITIDKTKKTTREDNTWLYLGIVLIIGCLVFLWFYLPRIKTGI
jgi:hypothetical protein